MNKEIHKGIMVRSRLINKFFKEKTAFTREAYNKQRDYCVKLIRESKLYISAIWMERTLQTKKIFWKTVRPNFSSKKAINENISSCEKNRLIADEKSIAVK